MTTTAHHCHAHQCEVNVPPEMLMCHRHWALVPKPLQRAVWRNYRPGQCNDKKPSRDWIEAANAAINVVAELERAAPERSVKAPARGAKVAVKRITDTVLAQTSFQF